ncbi:hypothetical protein HY990_06870 [Candidatus Micrarchaeota archaeon]|nr:hypothetical protein [Candidatus Micrarchaeota archaeon]
MASMSFPYYGSSELASKSKKCAPFSYSFELTLPGLLETVLPTGFSILVSPSWKPVLAKFEGFHLGKPAELVSLYENDTADSVVIFVSLTPLNVELSLSDLVDQWANVRSGKIISSVLRSVSGHDCLDAVVLWKNDRNEDILTRKLIFKEGYGIYSLDIYCKAKNYSKHEEDIAIVISSFVLKNPTSKIYLEKLTTAALGDLSLSLSYPVSWSTHVTQKSGKVAFEMVLNENDQILGYLRLVGSNDSNASLSNQDSLLSSATTDLGLMNIKSISKWESYSLIVDSSRKITQYRSSGQLSDSVELYLSIFQEGKYVFYLILISPSKSAYLYPWMRAKRAYELILSSLHSEA